MKRLASAATIVAMVGVAHAAPQCPSAQDGPPSQAVATAQQGPTEPQARPIPASEIGASPALARIASNGAALFDIGRPEDQHGLRAVYARNGDHFRVFFITADNQAEIGGVMWDAAGHNITRDEVAPIRGTIPTVVLDTSRGTAGGAGASAVNPVGRLAATSFGLHGRKDAPRVYVVVDPLCPFSIRALQTLQPYVDAGRVQLAIVPISINDHENGGTSTPAATAMLSVPPDDMVSMWRRIITLEHAPADISVSDGAAAALKLNLAAAHAIGVRGTPTVVWSDRKGMPHEEAGLPDDTDGFVAGLAP
ncbi:DsbC family protein [Komagataeibacter sp. FNDCR2]|uniref:DsbC family protein n=1 Tax=Komagataeibacter sp. FNDCR2 TaxID=2878682 RepID=UPI001E4D9573|nr:DsbC family protein [Komagataeibacter sp. FNDCR2]MCE2576686.1 DsbC family protein [Komagataeibacter sp. FNDCR2]